MSNDSSLLYSLLYRVLYNISHAFHSIDINTRFIFLFLCLFSLLFNSFPSHFSTRDILILFISNDDVLELYTSTRKSYLKHKCNSAKGMYGFAWTWGSMDIAWLCSTHGVPCSIYAPWWAMEIPWGSMETPWCSMVDRVTPMVCHGKSMVSDGKPLVSHGKPKGHHGVFL